jgi:hypothetical protein
MLMIHMALRETCCLLVFAGAVTACSGEPSAPSDRLDPNNPAVTRTPSTVVTAVYPGSDVIPENQLRMYVQFSGPMQQQGGLGHIAVVDRTGQDITGAMRPLDTELWNDERTRYTLLFDPGRAQREILPHPARGRSLRRGQTITLVVKTDWLDARGVPLKSEFKRQYRVGPPDKQPLSTLRWHIVSPPALTRRALTISFPEPLDHARLLRAIGVSHAGAVMPGEVGVEPGETQWTFVPRDPWQPGVYTVVVQPSLEDLAGNRIGRAVTVRSRVAPEDDRPVSLPFRVATPSAR